MTLPLRATAVGAFDVIGVGFGPSNLALAVALEEAPEASQMSRMFLDGKMGPVWHPGMLLEDSLIQISVLKDLATVRNPQSRFTFLSYLKEKGRLFEFLNLRDLFPGRIEFNDYLVWVAEALSQRVRWGTEVTAIHPEPGEEPGSIDLLRVVSRDLATGESQEMLTRNIVLATGGIPAVPPPLRLVPGGRAFHNHEFLRRMRNDFPDKTAPYKFAVVGAGQSGAELFSYLLTHYPNAEVTATLRRFAYKPVDDSHFTNEIFFPQRVDWLYSLTDEKRARVLDMCRDVNYAVVDAPLIQQIYRQIYNERAEGKNRATLLPFLELREIEEREATVWARFQNTLEERPHELEVDALILATGYHWPSDHPLLAEVASHLERDPVPVPGGGYEYRIRRDYRVEAKPGFAPGVYLQGFSERRHGASETVLSLLPIRAGNILDSLVAAECDLESESVAVKRRVTIIQH
ncbi:MAG TPA: SidA/IucD/PvdA family monooxygenase [Thermoanaerobaculia bacterium]|nr:SidA/IucD/PvdA family monooxygenase [Thermoanaerobaculia bacterium]